MPLSIVAHTYSGGLNTPPTTVSITPTAANQLIVVIANNTGFTSISISSSPSLTWTQQYNVNNGSGFGFGSIIVVWYAISTSNSSVSITVSSNAVYTDVEAIVISGANNSSPFDTNSSFPAHNTTTSGTSLTTTFSTSGTNELVIASVGKNHTSTGGFSFSTSFGNPTTLDATTEDGFVYNTSSTQLSNATFTASWSSSDSAGMITFAIVPPSLGSMNISSSVSKLISSGHAYGTTNFSLLSSKYTQLVLHLSSSAKAGFIGKIIESIAASLIASSKILSSINLSSLASIIVRAPLNLPINLSSSALEKITEQVVSPILHLSFNINLLLGGKIFPTNNLSILATIKNNTLFSLTENLKSQASLASNALILNKNIFLSSFAKVGPPTHLSFVISKSVITSSAVKRKISISSLLTNIIASEIASPSVNLSANIIQIITSSTISGEITLSFLAVIINNLFISGNSSIISNAILVNNSSIKENININSFITINNKTFLDLTENIVAASTEKILSQFSTLQENIKILSNLKILNQFISLSNHIGLFSRVKVIEPLTSTISVSTSVIVYKKIRTQITVLLEPKSLELYLSPKD